MRFIATIGALVSCLSLAACFELTASSKFQEDGTAHVTIEFGISAQLLAIAQSGKGGSDPFSECGNIQRTDDVPKGIKIEKMWRGAKGDKITCNAVIQIDDPVKVAGEFKREVKDDDPLIIDGFKLTRLGDNGYRLESLIETNPKVVEKRKSDKSDGAAMGMAMAATMMANHYITFSVSGVRVANTTGELSADNRTATWRLPVVLLVSPVAGFRQEIRADIIFRETWWDKAKRYVGFE